jgi:uridine kinase
MYIVLISGASGCGKSTIINIIKNVLQEQFTVHLMSIDQFYHSLKPGDTNPNWDVPFAIDWDLLVDTIVNLKNCNNVLIPHYDYITHQRIPNKEIILGNTDIVLLEGIFAFYNSLLCNLVDLKIFIDADPITTCLHRRYERDSLERSRDGYSIIKQYIDQVLPGYERYIKPYKQYADICYNNDTNNIPKKDSVFIQMIVNYIKNVLSKRFRR